MFVHYITCIFFLLERSLQTVIQTLNFKERSLYQLLELFVEPNDLSIERRNAKAQLLTSN